MSFLENGLDVRAVCTFRYGLSDLDARMSWTVLLELSALSVIQTYLGHETESPKIRKVCVAKGAQTHFRYTKLDVEQRATMG